MPLILSAAKNLQRDDAMRVNDLLVVPAFVDTLHAAGLDSLDALFNVQSAESLIKPGLQSWRERLRFQMNHQGQPRIFYIKRFTRPPAAGRREVRQAANGARSVAGIEWNWMHALAADGIPCTKPVAFGEEFHRGREARSAVVMEAVPGESLEKWAASLPSPFGRGVGGEGFGAREHGSNFNAVFNELATLVASFHSHGYVHRDLYLAHIFYDPSAPGAALRLIDLQRVFRPKLWPSRWIIKDLAALNYSTPTHVASPTDRFRWLMQYAQHCETRTAATIRGAPLRKWCKQLAIQIAGKTQQIARHDERRTARVDQREVLRKASATTPSA